MHGQGHLRCVPFLHSPFTCYHTHYHTYPNLEWQKHFTFVCVLLLQFGLKKTILISPSIRFAYTVSPCILSLPTISPTLSPPSSLSQAFKRQQTITVRNVVYCGKRRLLSPPPAKQHWRHLALWLLYSLFWFYWVAGMTYYSA